MIINFHIKTCIHRPKNIYHARVVNGRSENDDGRSDFDPRWKGIRRRARGGRFLRDSLIYLPNHARRKCMCAYVCLCIIAFICGASGASLVAKAEGIPGNPYGFEFCVNCGPSFSSLPNDIILPPVRKRSAENRKTKYEKQARLL